MLLEIFKLSICACLAVVGGWETLAAQPTPANAKPQFEVASVKPVQTAAGPDRGVAMMRMWEMMPPGALPMPDPGRLHIQGWSLRQLVAAAYRVRSDKVSGPSWMEDERFDIEAKLPEGFKPGQAQEMLQSLLAERFGLELHDERRELPGFALVVGKRGTKLEEFVPPVPPAESSNPEESQEEQKEQAQERMKAIQAQMQERMRSGPRMAGRSWSSWKGITATQWAEHLASMAGGPVEDETGLSGKYNIAIETWRATDDEPEHTVFDAVEELGLKLVPRKVPVDLLVIDKVSKTPTPN